MLSSPTPRDLVMHTRLATKSEAAFAAVLAIGLAAEAWGGPTLDGLSVQPESRCAPYDARQYRYPANLDRRHVEALGWTVDAAGRIGNAFPSPYVPGISFRYLQDMDIEHVVARSEAHDSGLCAHPERWSEFASDPLNVTVAGEHVNRSLKRGRDAAEWLPDVNRCSFARTVVAVKARYGLSVDAAERDALAGVLARCGE